MDCCTFEKHQLGFVDGTLPDTLVVEMQIHLTVCERCARRDTALRRGLMVLRNLPEIEPSADFTDRLEARLKAGVPVPREGSRLSAPNAGALAAAALGVIAAGYFAFASLGPASGDHEPMLAPVIASQPDFPRPQLFDHVVLMPAAAGLPMWPSALMVEQAPVQFMTAEMQMADWFWGR